MRTEHSRAQRLAEGVTAVTANELALRLDEATIMITIDPDMPNAALVARVLTTTLRRGPGNLVLVNNRLPTTLIDTIDAATAAIDPTRPIRVATSNPDTSIRVHVGAEAPGHTIRVVPEGCGAHIASTPTARIRPTQPGNALGAIYASALAAAEIFKHTAAVVDDRRVIHRHLRFCPVTLSTNLTRSPALDDVTRLALTLVGIGAIGTAIVLIISELNAEGVLLAVDRQHFALENRGTYSLGGDKDTRTKPWKTDLAKRTLSRFDVTPCNDDIDAVVQRIDAGQAPWHPTVLTALDTPDARRSAQRLWPDRLIDAATGDTMLGLHDHRHGIDPCMACHFPVRTDEPSGVQAVADMLGLSAHLLANGEAILQEAHLTGLLPAQRARLAPHVGSRMCGLARATGLTDLNADGYMPSIPFVSMQAACLAVGRLIASQLNLDVPGNLVQYDSLIGPHQATTETMRIRPGCICVSRATTINQVRTYRRSAAAPLAH
ncbi:hypothetical protein [Asanoa siamensis]|uniref:ThiF family protein n=1 Tax=Asanoa siamensis TaxID=926357 RepID=A0ABQ4CZB2_9ACTN|nr:hypothetical protein [Asanoa siamensis]GIF76192.1 hypothetical protein Asi02nite_57100 [Asanoa siamensis]